MIRFLLGAAVGALLLALVQYRFAPIPSFNAAVAPAADTDATPLEDAGERRTEGRESSGQQSEIASTRSRATAPTPTEVDVDAEAGDSDQPSGPANPIQLPETHAGFVRKSARSLPDEHTTLENEEVDPAWAELVEGLIYSHIATHPQGEAISIVSLVCRTSRCEIAGTVYTGKGGEIWRQVLSDMQQQPWFATNFEQSMYGAGGGLPGEHRFLTMLARVGTEISPPVAP